MQDVFSNFDLVVRAFLLTLALLAVSGLISLILGLMLAAFRVAPVPVLRWFGTGYVGVFRNTPLLIIFIFVFFGLPRMEINFPFFVKGCLALSLYTAAFVCEAIRSGVNSIPLGQAEAARAIGLTFSRTMSEVVLPQAVRAVVPPLASVMIALAKNTSVAAGFGLMELTGRMRFFTNNNVADRWWIFLTFALAYVIIVELISSGAITLERRWRTAR
ncbi:MAG: amino acid ABC transporter permease [Nocardioidaceae bacterium]|jgi:glutamate transport system permease protein|nr:amino acid ABC transporter permease [Nocardioidaceae bacterium]